MKNAKLFLSLFLFGSSFSQTYIQPGNVYGTWTFLNSPYYIEGEITIPNDSTLTIEPGVLIEFQGYYSLNVQGQLLAVGTEASDITFTVNDTTGFYNSDTTLGGWYGIRFIDTPIDNDTSKIINCNIQYGKAVGPGWFWNAGGAFCILHFDKVIISNCYISNCSAGGSGYAVGGALAIGWSDIQLYNNVISNCKADAGGAIHIYESDLIFAGNIIENNSAIQGGGVDIQMKSHLIFLNNMFIDNYASANGGAINIGVDSVVATFSECNLIGNLAFFGGAIYALNCELQLNNCNLTDNAAQEFGGGINAANSSIEIFNSTFERETSGNGGGGIFTWSTQLQVNECNFLDNSAINWGGAIFTDSTVMHSENNSFLQNNSDWGGAIGVLHTDIFSNHDEFNLNASDHGGAIYSQFGNLQIDNSSFTQNTSIWGGGMSTLNCNVLIDSCLFSQNSVENDGGAVEYIIDTLGFIEQLTIQISNSEYISNVSNDRWAGIIINQTNSNTSLLNMLIDKCLFKNNSANSGTALRIMGHIDDILVSNSIFENNFSSTGTSIFGINGGGNGKVENCVFFENQPSAATIAQNSFVDFINSTFVNNFGSNAGFHLRNGGIASLTNCIFWGNGNNPINLNTVSAGCSLTVNYCNIEYGLDSIFVSDPLSIVNWGIGNIDSDPLFIDTLNNDFHLQDPSPCIATGIDSIEIAGFWIHSPSTDIEGNSRPNPAGTMPDMGAYESQYPSSVIEIISSLPKEFILYQNFPNPCNPSTTIKYSIPQLSSVQIKIYDVLGNEIETLVSGEKPAGTYELTWSAANLPSGVYFYQLKAGDFISTKKMILMK